MTPEHGNRQHRGVAARGAQACRGGARGWPLLQLGATPRLGVTGADAARRATNGSAIAGAAGGRAKCANTGAQHRQQAPPCAAVPVSPEPVDSVVTAEQTTSQGCSRCSTDCSVCAITGAMLSQSIATAANQAMARRCRRGLSMGSDFRGGCRGSDAVSDAAPRMRVYCAIDCSAWAGKLPAYPVAGQNRPLTVTGSSSSLMNGAYRLLPRSCCRTQNGNSPGAYRSCSSTPKLSQMMKRRSIE